MLKKHHGRLADLKHILDALIMLLAFTSRKPDRQILRVFALCDDIAANIKRPQIAGEKRGRCEDEALEL